MNVHVLWTLTIQLCAFETLSGCGGSWRKGWTGLVLGTITYTRNLQGREKKLVTMLDFDNFRENYLRNENSLHLGNLLMKFLEAYVGILFLMVCDGQVSWFSALGIKIEPLMHSLFINVRLTPLYIFINVFRKLKRPHHLIIWLVWSRHGWCDALGNLKISLYVGNLSAITIAWIILKSIFINIKIY